MSGDITITNSAPGIVFNNNAGKLKSLTGGQYTGNVVSIALPPAAGTLATREWTNSNIQDGTSSLRVYSTITSSYTFDRKMCLKRNGIVIVSGRIYGVNPKLAANLNYFVIPEGFRPSAQTVGMACMVVYQPDGTTSVGTIFLSSIIDTNGNVNVTYGAAYKTDQVFFYAVYPAA